VAYATRVKSLTLALVSDAKSSALALASGKMFTVLVLGFEPKIVKILAFCHHVDPWKAVQHESQFTVLHSLF